MSSALLLALTAAAVPAASAAPRRPHEANASLAPRDPRVARISTAADGTQADGVSMATLTTRNGRFVAFRSTATNLVPEGIAHPGTYAYVRDLRTGADPTVTSADAGAIAVAGALGDKGVVFSAEATDPVPGDTNGVPDIFSRRLRPTR
ncbi:hypothetical protein [Streptomyces ipomoeae]|uniref:hypothetical protein n=1 Tax=Streptomyces ipomoeae TaxID=103232 RepID=UPI0015F01575|nr:hypothetical protein [Streptomyces ipomoeae]MDX2933627.1 hypothetical protein [Streptomyces ipomoeae]